MRSSFTRSPLARLLGAEPPAPPTAPGMDFAERMSVWVDAFAAVRLQGELQAVRAIGAATGRAMPPSAPALFADVQRVRAALAKAIAREVEHEDADAPQAAAYRQRHLELQHQMELMIAPLRDHVRQALARGSARLRQLAALDATLDDVLARREQALLPATATLVERRFGQLELPAFEQHWRDVLQAEVDLRLQRITGLVEAVAAEPLPSS